MPSRRIVLGLDGSAGAEAALEWCVQHAPLLDAEVVAVHVLDPSPLYFGPATIAALQPPIKEVEEQRRLELDAWAKRLGDRGIAHRVEMMDGLVAPTLDRVARDEDADLIVVGRRGAGGLAEMILGSVPHKLAHHAHVPLVVVPA